MAKIVTITNPLTGQPAQVDQLDHTAQQIDDGLNIARGVSNPNLLDNWYFGNPVDQRGGYVVPPGVAYYVPGIWDTADGTTTNYVKVDRFFVDGTGTYPIIIVNGADRVCHIGTAVRGYTGTGYGIDRWKIHDTATGNLIVKDGYIEVSLTGLYSSLMQVFEKRAIVEGTYTLSVLTTSGLYKWTFEASKTTPATSPIGWFGIPNAYSYFNYNEDGTSNLYLFDNASSGTISVSAIAAKLELGTQQTLAHQDANGNLQLNSPPNYADTLARCQVSLIDLNPNAIDYFFAALGIGWSGGTEVDFVIPVPVTMRANPSIIDLANFYAVDIVDGTWHSLTSANCFAGSGIIKLVGYIDASVQGRTYALACNNVSKKMLLSAEIL